ncbi:MAG: PAS domain S-box protein [Chlorobi bacterium]|nr:PAS domain S-box protein [Chlorobiota bacterium]
MIGRNVFELVHPDDRERISIQFAGLLGRMGGIEQVNFRFLHKNGTWLYIEGTGKNLLNFPRIKGIVVNYRDVTKRLIAEQAGKQSEEALRNSEYLLRESQKVAALGSYILDIPSGAWKSSSILDDIYGIDKEYNKDIAGWLQVVHPDDQALMQDYFTTNVLGNHEPFNKEYRIKRINDQQERWVHGLGKLEFNDDGDPIKMIGTIQDITERKQAEIALQSIATQFSTISGLEFFEKVCRHLTKTLQIDYAFVGEFLPRENKVRVKAGIGKGKSIKTFDYDLDGTPCENVVVGAVRCYPSSVQSLFPKDYLLVEMGIESYIGIPLHNRAGGILGIMVLLDCKPIVNTEISTSLLRIFSERVAAEIERMQAEEALQENERKLHTLFNNLQGIAYRCKNDCNWTMEYISAGFEDITGYHAEDVINNKKLSFSDLIIPKDRERIWNEVQAALEKRERYELNYQIRTASGETRYMLEKGIGICSTENGDVLALEGFITDITTQVQADEALRRSEELNRSITQTAADAIISINADGIILSWNNAAEKIFGYSSSEMLNMDLSVIIPNKYKIGHHSGIERLGKGGSKKVIGETIEIIALRKDGTEFPIDLSLSSWETGNQKFYTGIIRDITERKQTEEALCERTERYELIAAGAYDAIWDWDVLNQRVYFSPRWKELRGLTQAEVSSSKEKWGSNIHPDDAPRVKAAVKAHLDGETEFFEEEYRIYCNNGSVKWILDRGIAQRNADGQVVRMAGSESDITERKQVQKALNERVKELQCLYSIAEIFEKQDITLDELYQETVRLLPASWQHPEVTGSCITVQGKVFRTKNFKKTRWMQNADINIKNKKVGSIKVCYLPEKPDKHGDPFLKEEWGLIKNIANQLGKHIERKQAEQIQKVLYNISNAVITTDNLKKLISLIQKELGTIIDTTNFYIALYDHKTNTLSLPFYADERNKITTLPAGKTLTEYVIKTKKPLLANIGVRKRLISEGELEHIEDPSKIWLGVPLRIEGEVTGVLAIQSYTDEDAYDESDMKMLEFVSDQVSISIERKKTELDLKVALENATESDRLKSAFLATMSHELRTPLNAIIGFSDLINKNLSIEEIISFAKIINSSGNHLLAIVKDLFDITLIETGEIKIVKEDVKLQSVLNEVHEIIKIEQQKINKGNLGLNLRIPREGEGLTVKTDPSKLKQILINLLKNALKFTHEGHIHYGYKIKKKQNKAVIEFYVKDTGIGIPKEKQEFVFDIFRQVEDSHTRMYGGAGIGLSISKKLSELLGGKSWFESEKGKGSTFYFTIPFDEFEEISKPVIKEAGKKNKFKEKTILIVEDDEISFKFLQILLEKSGVHTFWAKNGKAAIKICNENPNINLVLMDINMPVMNGLEATMEIKKSNPALPIIAQTAYATAGERERSLESGCDDYIAKPIKQEELWEKLKSLW